MASAGGSVRSVWIADTHSSLAQRIPRDLPCPAPGAVEPLRPSFDVLYQRHAAFTWRALRHLGVEAHAVDDAMQELWVIVHRRLSDFEARARLETWLFGIAVNVARNQLRAARRRAPLSADQTASGQVADGRSREERFEAFDLVHEFLATLDEPRREVFVSTLLVGMSAAETAEATGLDVGRVQNLVRALRRTFKAWLMEHGSLG
jgi:RNA polymerase sigma-70 factor, ECF subfamily